jgi:murein DD-endopeptidase MepM/ murein hydrolase activator NlpD
LVRDGLAVAGWGKMWFLRRLRIMRPGQWPANGIAVTISAATWSRSIQFRVSRSAGIGVLVGVLLLFHMGMLAVVLYGGLLREAREARGLRAENLQLHGQLAGLVELEEHVRELDSIRRAVLGVVGVTEPDSVEGLPVTVGGMAEGARPFYRQLEPDSLLGQGAIDEIARHLEYVPLEGPLTCGFGPLGRGEVFHTGVDIAADTGAPVRAVGEGVVSFVGSDETFGLVLVVSHTSRLETMYGHNSHVNVRVGDFVASGEEIATVGSTGQSSGPHLHFEVQWDGKAVNPIAVLPSIGERRRATGG